MACYEAALKRWTQIHDCNAVNEFLSIKYL